MGAFKFALSQRDLQLAENLLPKLERSIPRETYLSFVLAGAASMGSKLACNLLEKEIPNLLSHDIAEQKRITGAYVHGMGSHDEEQKALEALRPFFEHIEQLDSSDGSISPKDKGFFLNQYQRLLHGEGNFDEAKAIGAKVIELCPDDSTYYYNQSINYEATKDIDGAVKLVDQYMSLMEKLEKPDDDHLRRAVILYAKKGMKDKARKAFTLLQQVNPYKATLLEDDEDINRMIMS